MVLPLIMGEAYCQNPASHCLLCYENLHSLLKPVQLAKTLSCAQILSDIFQVFCKYMRWEPGPEFEYNFSNDHFPFCEDCKIVLMQIYKLHEDIQGIQKQIEQFVLSASARILVSEVKRAGSQPDHPEKKTYTQQKENWDESACDKNSQFYRKVILKHYSASVQLTLEDHQNVKEFVCKNVHLENDTQSQDQYVAHSVAIGSLQEPAANAQDNFKGSQDDSSHDGAGGEADDDDTRDSNYSANSSMEYSDNDDENERSTSKVCKKKETSGGQPGDKSPEKESFIRPPYKSRPIRGRIKEIRNDRYILDDKLEFEWTGHEWKCLACNTTQLVRQNMIDHLISKRCTGLASPGSVEVLEYLEFKYDKLAEDLFECRRCPHTSIADAEIKNHIKDVHYQPPRLSDRWKLARNASFTHRDSNVYLVNNEHSVRLSKRGKYSCEVCSFKSMSKNQIIVHVLGKHGAGRRRSILRIKKIGQNKYGLGDFSFARLIDNYKCCTCDFIHSALSIMKNHIRYEHIKDITKYVCESCGYNTLMTDAFVEHLKIHRNDRPFLCDVCGKSFTTRKNASSHRLMVHNIHLVQKNILCEQCGAKFPSQSRLNAHMKKHNTVKCDICGNNYSEVYLKVHLESHKNTGKKLFECKECGKKFKAKRCLYTHRRSCNGDRPYVCDICGMKFTQLYSVTRHKNVAHDPNKTTKTVARKQPKLRREEPKPRAQ